MLGDTGMRTTLSIDDDVLNAARQLAAGQRNGVLLLAGQPKAKPVTLQALVLL